jgi:hypothetical protein
LVVRFELPFNVWCEGCGVSALLSVGLLRRLRPCAASGYGRLVTNRLGLLQRVS